MKRTLVVIYGIVATVMFSFNIVEVALPYFTKGTTLYTSASLSLTLIYIALAFSNLVVAYLVKIMPLGLIITLGTLGYINYTIATYTQCSIYMITSGIVLGLSAAMFWLGLKLLIYTTIPREIWGRVFGAMASIATISGGLGPFHSIKLFR